MIPRVRAICWGFAMLADFVTGIQLQGTVVLDNLNVDKVVAHFEYSLVKFDTFYPTGDKHHHFATIARAVKEENDLLLAEINIKDFGDKNNKDLAERFGVDHRKEALPETILFKSDKNGGYEEVGRYGGDYSVHSLRRYLASKTGLYIPLDGCSRRFDELAKAFSRAQSPEERKNLLARGEALTHQSNHEQVYLQLMKLGVEDGTPALERERDRLEKLLTQRMSSSARDSLMHKMNILSSFHTQGSSWRSILP